jgi:hypothetical protein
LKIEDKTQTSLYGSDDDQHVLGTNAQLQPTTSKPRNVNSQNPKWCEMLWKNLGLENVGSCMIVDFFIFL